MELYVRSQDKERLERFNNATISSATILGEEEYYVLINFAIFGTYKTKQRAIEVISEIQELLQEKKCYANHISTNIVYEMPQK